jgi:hypothetical protein
MQKGERRLTAIAELTAKSMAGTFHACNRMSDNTYSV